MEDEDISTVALNSVTHVRLPTDAYILESPESEGGDGTKPSQTRISNPRLSDPKMSVCHTSVVFIAVEHRPGPLCPEMIGVLCVSDLQLVTSNCLPANQGGDMTNNGPE